MGWEKTELSKLNPWGRRGEEEVGGGGRRRRVEDGDLLVFKGSGGGAVVTNRILRRHIRKLTDSLLSWGGGCKE